MSDTTQCEADGCTREARMAIRTLRPTRPGLESRIYYDDRGAPKSASRYCKQHGQEIERGLSDMLVAADEATEVAA